MKPIYRKFSFWRRLPSYHPAIIGAALKTAFRSHEIHERFHEQCDISYDANCKSSGSDSAHQFWLDGFRSERDNIKSVLEIGAFKGSTTLFLGWLFPNARITCVDPWEDYDDVPKGMAEVGEEFRRNTAKLGNRIEAVQGYSASELPKMINDGRKFDLIFIDGSHDYGDVLIDSELAWRLIGSGGFIVWDDYFRKGPSHTKRAPKLAIDQFLTAYAENCKPLWAFRQVAIQRNCL